MTAPAFILSTKSLTEFSSYWTEHPTVFVAPAAEKDPAKRAMLVLKWFLSTLKSQYASRSEKLGSEKKPLNPFLGELFLGKWEDAAGTTELVSEQVRYDACPRGLWRRMLTQCAQSSSPGHGLLHLEQPARCQARGLQCPEGLVQDHHQCQGMRGWIAADAELTILQQVGHALLHLDAYDEYYLITLPPLHIEGLITGSPYVELNTNTYIQSSTGYTARIDYSGKGWVSGKKNTFSAVLYPEGKEKDILYKADGQWTDTWQIKDAKTKAVVATFDPTATPVTPLTIAPLAEQDDFETRRAWKKVADAITKGDMELTSAEKTIIENRQREMRRAEKEEGREWDRKFFSRAETFPLFEALANKVGESSNDSQTNGVWVFDQEKAKKATKPFHPDVTPPIYERV